MNPALDLYLRYYRPAYIPYPYYDTYMGYEYPNYEVIPLNTINNYWNDYDLIYFNPGGQHPFVPFTGY